MKKLTISLLLCLLVFITYSQQDQTINNLTLTGTIKGNQNGALRINTANGYIDIGPLNNSGYAHIYTDRTKFIFNQPVYSMGGFSSYNTDNLFLQTGGTTRMTIINSNGNVGIGSSAPAKKLELNGDMAISNDGLFGQGLGWGTTTAYNYATLKIYDSTTGYSILNNLGFGVKFQTASTDRITILNNGNIGIGTTPAKKLELYGDMAISNDGFFGQGLGWGAPTANSYATLKIYDNSTGYSVLNNLGFGIKFQTASTDRITILNNGNIGIGTTPSRKLELYGDMAISNDGFFGQGLGWGTPTANNYATLKIYDSSTGFSILNNIGFGIKFQTANTDRLTISNNGNISIGTTNPNNYKLAVEGTIAAREVKVTAEFWSDFVFHPTYKLRTLGEVEQFIKTNNHLPEIPTETEVKQNGIGLGEMNAKLLQKIEELTLYMIDQQKQINELKEQNSTFAKEIQAIKK